MTNFKLARQAIKLFNNYETTKQTKRRYQRDWMRCITTLGEKYVYAIPVHKLTPDQQRLSNENRAYRISPCSVDVALWPQPAKETL